MLRLVGCCPTGTQCVKKNDNYSQCLPFCNELVPSSCCNPGDGCINCQNLPDKGLCSGNSLNVGTLWKRVKFNENICCYKGDGDYYYDNGASCNQLVCERNNGRWSKSTECLFNKNISKLDYNLDSYFTKNGDYYELNKSLNVDNCNFINQLIDSNQNQYILASAKPKGWFCPI